MLSVSVADEWIVTTGNSTRLDSKLGVTQSFERQCKKSFVKINWHFFKSELSAVDTKAPVIREVYQQLPVQLRLDRA
jgi:hypothetical protein